MRRIIYCTVIALTLVAAASLTRQADAGTVATDVSISPMPFNAGDTVNITATAVGPFSNVTEYVSVSDGAQVLFEKRIPNQGSIASGQRKPFSVPWNVASNLKSNLSVFVVFLEGSESWVGEPGTDRSLKLVARCQSRPGKVPCKYATARYWIQTTRTP